MEGGGCERFDFVEDSMVGAERFELPALCSQRGMQEFGNSMRTWLELVNL
jgi:hypothetical protein